MHDLVVVLAAVAIFGAIVIGTLVAWNLATYLTDRDRVMREREVERQRFLDRFHIEDR